MAKKTINKNYNKTTATQAAKTKSEFKVPHWMTIVFLIILTFLVFFPTLSNNFVNWDDEPNFLKNDNVSKGLSWENTKKIWTEPVIGGYNPLPIQTFAIEHHFVEFEPYLYHLDNLLLHILVVCLVYIVGIQLNLSRIGALILALLFAIHPMRVESVAWVTERKDVLLGVFFMSAYYYYIKYAKAPEGNKRFLIISLLLFIVALFSKIQAVSLPLAMLVTDYYFRREWSWKLIIEKIPFFLASLAIGLLGIYFLAENKVLSSKVGLNFFERLLVGAYSYCVYWFKFLVPYRMSPLYPYPSSLDWTFYIAPIGVALTLLGGWWAHKNNYRQLVYGLLFFLVNVVFVLQIVGAGQGFIADRFTYIPYLGLFFIAAAIYEYLQKNKPAIANYYVSGMGIYLIILGVVTLNQVGIWKDGEKLWGHVLQYYQQAATPWNNRGQIYRERGNFTQALSDYNKGIALDTTINALNSRGLAYFSLGDVQKAIDDYTLAISIDSTDKEIPEVRINRAAAYARSGQFDKAFVDFELGLAKDTDNVMGFRNRYLAYIDTKNYPAALKDLDRYLELKPNEPDQILDRASLKRALNMLPEAMEDVNKALSLAPPDKPNIGMYYNERGRIYFAMGNKEAAKADALAAQQRNFKPDPNLLGQ